MDVMGGAKPLWWDSFCTPPGLLLSLLDPHVQSLIRQGMSADVKAAGENSSSLNANAMSERSKPGASGGAVVSPSGAVSITDAGL